jgi:hypothetical protein
MENVIKLDKSFIKIISTSDPNTDPCATRIVLEKEVKGFVSNGHETACWLGNCNN